MCEYCENNKKFGDILKYNLYIDILFQEPHIFIHDGNKILASYNIKFCPMCGRKLEWEE
jgi:hypothetical protein